MSVLLVHENVIFEDATVYLTGNAYFDCTFRRCTLIVREPAMVLTGCEFDSSCIWHIDMIIHDHEMWAAFLKTFSEFIAKTLPHAIDEKKHG